MTHLSTPGTLSSLALLAMGGIYLSRLAERVVLRALKAEAQSSQAPGLARACLGASPTRVFGRRPELLISPEPSPRAWITRSLGSRGKIVLSQGLLSQLGEDELAAVVACAVARAGEQRSTLQTLCAGVASRLDALFNRPRWSPLAAVASAFAYPIYRPLAVQGAAVSILSTQEGRPGPRVPDTQRAAFESARDRLSAFRRLHGDMTLVAPVLFL